MRAPRRLSLLALLLVLFARVPFAMASAPPVSLGVNLSNGPIGSQLDGYTRITGAAPRLVMWYQNWSEPLFYASQMSDVDSRGAIPLVTWMPQLSSGGGVPLTAISAGSQDDTIHQAARAAAAWGKPFMVRFAHEMNLSGSPYGPGTNGNTPAEFVAAWRHVVTLFRADGATNVRWVWSPNVDCAGQCRFEAFYPGDPWVDWVALDGYNDAAAQMSWMTLDQVFGTSYDEMIRLTQRPLMIGETASPELGGDKAAWIHQAFEAALPLRMPAVRAVVWFDRQKETDWRVDSSASSLAAYRSVVASPRYGGADLINPGPLDPYPVVLPPPVAAPTAPPAGSPGASPSAASPLTLALAPAGTAPAVPARLAPSWMAWTSPSAHRPRSRTPSAAGSPRSRGPSSPRCGKSRASVRRGGHRVLRGCVTRRHRRSHAKNSHRTRAHVQARGRKN